MIGRDPLNSAMKTLSEHAKLSKIYTNHCIRASVVTKLDEEGFEARHIMVVSSHKSENSIKSYSSKCPEKKKKQMFDALAKPFAPSNAKNPQKVQNSPAKPEQFGPKVSTPAPDPNFQIVDLFPNMDEDPLSDEHFLATIESIEKEN